MKFDQIVRLPVTRADVLAAIEQAQRHRFVDNLRRRHPNVAFDSKVRGYVGELAMGRWLRQHDVTIDATNQHDGTYRPDVDFAYRGFALELKTSLLPDADRTLRRTFERRDIKLIKRGRFVEDLEGEVHVQILFDTCTKSKDDWLRAQRTDLTAAPETLYDTLCGRAYLNRTYLVGWMDKSTLVERIYELPEHRRTWGHAQRQFWVCPLREAYPPRALVRFLGFYRDRLF